jgi:hypothetical protein
MKGCLNLKMLIEGGKLIIHDSNTMNELRTFVKDGDSYSADANKFDDCVMSLVVFAWASTQAYFINHIVEKTASNLFDENELFDILPFGIIINGIEDDNEFYRKLNVVERQYPSEFERWLNE